MWLILFKADHHSEKRQETLRGTQTWIQTLLTSSGSNKGGASWETARLKASRRAPSTERLRGSCFLCHIWPEHPLSVLCLLYEAHVCHNTLFNTVGLLLKLILTQSQQLLTRSISLKMEVFMFANLRDVNVTYSNCEASTEAISYNCMYIINQLFRVVCE